MQFTDDIFVQYEGFTGWLVGCTVPSGLNQASQGQRSNSNKKKEKNWRHGAWLWLETAAMVWNNNNKTLKWDFHWDGMIEYHNASSWLKYS